MNFHYSKIFCSNRLATLLFLLIVIQVLFLFTNCSSQQDTNNEIVVVGIASDVTTINPLYAFNVVEGHLVDLLFQKPAMEVWDESLGRIVFKPMLAEKWEWNNDSSSITLFIRENIYWSDGTKITADDFIFSFELYSDPEVGSRFLGEFEEFPSQDGIRIDIGKTFEVIAPNVLKINFNKSATPDLLDINLEILPKHIWSKYERSNIANASENFEPVTSGPFKLVKWEKNSALQLAIDSSSYLYNPENIKSIIFKVLTDYRSRITHLKTGNVDLLENIKNEDTQELLTNKNISIKSLRGREYDYVGWNHFQADAFQKGKSIPNKFFSSAEVRKALALAINREEILETHLGDFGEICKGPVSPIFKSYYDNDIPSIEYNPELAKKILNENGWIDKNNNGILKKNNVEFKFDLFINSGNPRREYSATIIKNNLKAVGIEVNIKTLETGVFIDRLMKRDFDAWLSGWTIPLPIDMTTFWSSDKNSGIFNFSNYKHSRVDEIIRLLNTKIPDSEKTLLYKELQKILYDDQPHTFLFWVDNILAYNKRIVSPQFSLLGVVKNAWEWKIEN